MSLTGLPDTFGSRSKEVLPPDQQSERCLGVPWMKTPPTLVAHGMHPADPGRILLLPFLVEEPWLVTI
jgi:hypothetical protein